MSNAVDISLSSVRRARSAGRNSATLASDRTLDASEPLEFAAFYEAEGARIGRAFTLTLQDSELAEDALNEAMTRALLKWQQVGTYANPSGWVYRTGLNWARSWLRRRRRERDRRLHERPVVALLDVEPGLDAALKRLSDEHRAVIVCRFHLDWSTAETAEALEIAEGTVKSRLSRGIDQIRRDLGVTTHPTDKSAEGQPR